MVASTGGSGASSGEAAGRGEGASDRPDRCDRRQHRRRRAVRECQTPGVDKSPDLPSKASRIGAPRAASEGYEQRGYERGGSAADLETHGGFSEDFWRSEMPPHWGKS
ncbi:hypothetical protein FRX94_04510 [Corynebacterium canis]|uniref:Uncharacterized protein n=1 Tax=Corynebacterium canis TaxID=679663 RepID=A0A5C5UM53_9CORY|nr:hypothetical protein [Corynebacterium canis]TWT26663.1 hypothetical protein FRX94_04510 [Corynebacterium canis]